MRRALPRLEGLLRSAVAGRVVLPGADARERHDFGRADGSPDGLESLAMGLWTAATRVQRGLQVASRLASRRRPVPASAFREIQDEATKGGATAVGLAAVTPDLVFAGGSAPTPHALVVLLPMDKKAVKTAPSWECLRSVNETYAQLEALTGRLSRYLSGKGFTAFPSEAVGGAVDYPSLASRAGLGALGASGLLISPGNGPCQRIGTVFVELEEPAPRRSANLDWIPEYCAKCQRCVRACPAKAIRVKPPRRADGHFACVDGDLCLPQFQRSWGCSVCVKVCPLMKSAAPSPP